jgi:hypothetical protein
MYYCPYCRRSHKETKVKGLNICPYVTDKKRHEWGYDTEDLIELREAHRIAAAFRQQRISLVTLKEGGCWFGVESMCESQKIHAFLTFDGYRWDALNKSMDGPNKADEAQANMERSKVERPS